MGFYQREVQTKEPLRKRRRKKVTVPEAKKEKKIEPIQKVPNFKLMTAVEKQKPPDTNEEILVYGPDLGFYLCPGYVALQHIEYDFKALQKLSRITHWFSTLDL